jgi:predicted permease
MLLQDIRYALRQLRKSPGFTLTAVLTLALGIGALTTVATWTNAVLFSPWPHVEAPRQLRFVSATVLGSQGYSVHYDQYDFVRGQGRSWEGTAAFAWGKANLTTPDAPPQAIPVGMVSASYFSLLGLRPQAGRFFNPHANDRAFGANNEVVLSDQLWRMQFGANPAIVGRTIEINRRAFTVIGVAPRDFSGIFGGMEENAWLPLSSLGDLSADSGPDPLKHFGLQVAVRMRPGISDATAAAELHTLAHSFSLLQNDKTYSGWDLNLNDSAHFERGMFSMVGEMLPILAVASVLLMILVCMNIASLLAQNAARRQREVAIRTALGASPKRIAAQIFLETGLLAMLGGMCGWGMSVLMSRSLYLLLASFGPALAFNLRTDLRIVLFIVAIVLAVTLVCGMLPLRQSLRSSQREALHRGSNSVTGVSGRRLGRRILLGLQLAICFVVLVCSGLLTRTALNVFNRDPGFNRANCITAEVDFARSGYKGEQAQAFRGALLDRLRVLPGVTGATFTSHLPMGDNGSGNTQEFGVPGYVPGKNEDMEVVTDFEGPDFFRTMGIAIDRGRDFSTSDTTESAPVAIVNEAMARHYWPNGDAIGHSIEFRKKAWQVVGVVPNYAYHNPQDTDPFPVLYMPITQTGFASYTIFAVRTRNDAGALEQQLRQAVSSLDGALPVENVRTLEDVTSMMYLFSRIPAELLGVYALSSLFVAMMGLYAVIAFTVVERHREFGLRMALGSTRAAIFRLVLAGNASIAAIGLVIGGAASIAAVRLLRSMLFGVAPFDPVSFVAAAVALLLALFASGFIPARRAASIEPMQALRSE